MYNSTIVTGKGSRAIRDGLETNALHLHDVKTSTLTKDLSTLNTLELTLTPVFSICSFCFNAVFRQAQGFSLHEV